MTRSQRLTQKLKELNPVHLELVNESDMHAGPPGRESHFKLLFVSDVFNGLSRVDRQRKVFDLLKEEMANGLHALSLRLLTSQEWSQSQVDFQSPECASSQKERK